MNKKIILATPLYPPEIGGPATYTKLLEEYLPKHGIEVVILPFSEVRHLPNGIRQIAYFFKTISRSRGCDLIYAQDTISVGWPAFFASLFVWKKFAVRVPGDHIWEQGAQRFGITGTLDEMKRFSLGWHPYLQFLRVLQYFVVRYANLVITPSTYMKRIAESWGARPERVHVVYSSIELPIIAQEPQNRPDGFLITTIARLVPWKGIDALIRVVAENPEWKLTIIGDGPERKNLETLAQKLRVHDRVQFTGQLSREKALGWAKVSDAFVLNSTYEGLSHVLIEVLSLGVPAIATNVGGNPEVVHTGENGILISSGNDSELKASLQSLEQKPELRRRFAQASPIFVQQHFSIDQAIGKVTDLLSRI